MCAWRRVCAWRRHTRLWTHGGAAAAAAAERSRSPAVRPPWAPPPARPRQGGRCQSPTLRHATHTPLPTACSAYCRGGTRQPDTGACCGSPRYSLASAAASPRYPPLSQRCGCLPVWLPGWLAGSVGWVVAHRRPLPGAVPWCSPATTPPLFQILPSTPVQTGPTCTKETLQQTADMPLPCTPFRAFTNTLS